MTQLFQAFPASQEDSSDCSATHTTFHWRGSTVCVTARQLALEFGPNVKSLLIWIWEIRSRIQILKLIISKTLGQKIQYSCYCWIQMGLRRWTFSRGVLQATLILRGWWAPSSPTGFPESKCAASPSTTLMWHVELTTHEGRCLPVTQDSVIAVSRASFREIWCQVKAGATLFPTSRVTSV